MEGLEYNGSSYTDVRTAGEFKDLGNMLRQ